jgi:hypothetical protein
MNRKITNLILGCFATLFVVMSLAMILYLAFFDVADGTRWSLLIQSGILLLGSITLCIAIYRSTSKK